MQTAPITKYIPFPPVHLPGRQWPSRTITRAPIWCSVDLRDGNQALAQPMSVAEKLEYFEMLVRIGFKEIEVGFPSASQIEFDFCRRLIEENRIPADVSIQLLCQCREDLITRSLEAVRGARNVIFHLYNSTSPYQRDYVFGASRDEIKAIAVNATRFLKREAQRVLGVGGGVGGSTGSTGTTGSTGGMGSTGVEEGHGLAAHATHTLAGRATGATGATGGAGGGTNMRLEYSPESFTSTELDFALEICEAVTDAWGPTAENKIILNLPATVEYTTPNVHADQIEWMCTHLTRRELTVVSLHTHNDRGTGVAATELGLLAGADRVEGTLFGNGERTGNLDITTVALNMYTDGVDPRLDFSLINAIRETYERCTRMEVHPRHPYAGELVFTAFSGSHQDAIKKSMARQKPGAPWTTLYIPIDPADIGRNYKAIIRINSQSGKGGVAYVLETDYGYQLPKLMHKEIGKIINDLADKKGTELAPEQILAAFENEYIKRDTPLALDVFKTTEKRDNTVRCEATVRIDNGKPQKLIAQGNGPIDAFVRALAEQTALPKFELISYNEHSLGKGAEARAASYIQIKTDRGRTYFGVGIDTSIERASIKAVVSALNRAVAYEVR